MKPIEKHFFERDCRVCARELIGSVFYRGGTSGRVVETEAYSEINDEACHTFFRPSARQFVKENDAGTAYVYMNYGRYWLTNVLCVDRVSGERGFVLLRALEPLEGIEIMKRRRNMERPTDLCSGPGKLSMAMGIGKSDHGTSLISSHEHGFHVEEPETKRRVVADRRVGISKAKELKWRFLEPGNPHVSVPFGKVKP